MKNQIKDTLMNLGAYGAFGFVFAKRVFALCYMVEPEDMCFNLKNNKTIKTFQMLRNFIFLTVKVEHFLV